MERYREPLSNYYPMPDGMVNYLRFNGFHFNKKLCEWSVSKMRRLNTATGKMEKIDPMSKEQAEELLTKNNVKLENNSGWDFVYVVNMAKADFWKSSIVDEPHLALYVKDVIDDPDQTDGFILNRFIADCVRCGVGIPWEEVL